jgi:hypothetical protein
MSRTIKAIQRHMVLPSARSDSANPSLEVRRKPERKLRVVFAPWPLHALTTAHK